MDLAGGGGANREGGGVGFVTAARRWGFRRRRDGRGRADRRRGEGASSRVILAGLGL